MSPPPSPESDRTNAAIRRSRWPGWIWAVPIAALLLVGWWAFRSIVEGGETITISFSDVHGMKEGNTTVVYRGMNIGQVKAIALAKNGGTVDVTVHIKSDATRFLTSGTLFWLRGAQPSLSNLSSLGAVLSGPTIVMAPGPGKRTTHFVGRISKPVISGAHGPPQLYEVSLSGSVGGLKPGGPVKLRGFTVGEVKDVGFGYDASTGKLSTPVTLALYPALFHIEGTGSDAALATALDRLIKDGLRARLERDPPLVGNPQVSLDIVQGASPATPGLVNGLPQIPAAAGGGIASIIARVNKVPIDQIAQNLLDTTHHIDQLVSSPRLDDAITELDATLKQIHRTADTAGPKIGKLADSLRKTAARLDETARAADRTLGGASSQNGAQQAMHEITEAARSVRELADYLDRHPEALVQGRSGP